MLEAIYARDCYPIHHLVEKHKVSHVLYNGNRFQEDVWKSALMFEPFDEWFRANIGKSDGGEFQLAVLAESTVVYSANGLSLLDANMVVDQCRDQL